MPRYCTICGGALEENVSVCNHCGSDPNATPEPKAAPLQPEPQTTPVLYAPPQPRFAGYPRNVAYAKVRTPGRGFGIVSLILGSIGAFYSMIFLTSVLGIGQGLEELEQIIAFSFEAYAYGESMPLDMQALLCVTFGVFAGMGVAAVCFAISSKKRGYRALPPKLGLLLGIAGIAMYLISVFLIMSA